MAENPQNRFPLREQRARREARAALNREHRDILVGSQCGTKLKSFLEQNGIHVIATEESFGDMLGLAGDADLDRVEQLIEDWEKGADFAPSPD